MADAIFQFHDHKLIEHLSSYMTDVLGEHQSAEITAALRDHLLKYRGSSINITELHALNQQCKRCVDSLTPNPSLPHWNVVDPQIICIAESPGMSEQAASLFISTMKRAEIKSSNIMLTYLARCPAPNRKHTETEINHCSSFLHSELDFYKPLVIVPLGSVVCDYIYGQGVIKITQNHGQPRYIGPWLTIPTFSPAYVAHANSNVSDIFLEDFKSIRRFCSDNN